MSPLFPPFLKSHPRGWVWVVVVFSMLSAGAQAAEFPPTSGPTVPGDRAMLKGVVAYAPQKAPLAIKRAIWATNTLANKPYVWGGGHGTFYDRGYDCSGTISFFLHHAGLLDAPTPSRGFMSYGESGRGKWVTIYVRNGHVFAEIAGLRLDTTGMREQEGPRWRGQSRSLSGFIMRRPVGF